MNPEDNTQEINTNLGSAISEEDETVPPEEVKPPETPLPKAKKSISLPLILAIVSLILLAVLYILFFTAKLGQNSEINPAETPATTTQVRTLSAYVAYLSGDAWNYVDGRKVEIKEGDTLKQGDKVETADNTRMVLVFDEGSVLRMDKKTIISLEEISPANILLAQESGYVFSRVNKDADHRYQIEASGVKVEALGTAFSLQDEDTVIVKVFESSVKVKEIFGGETEVQETQEWNNKDKQLVEMDVTSLESDEFLAWSIEEEAELKEKIIPVEKEKPEPVALPEPAPKEIITPEPEKTVSENGIKLSGKALDNGIFVEWSVSGLDITNGFKIVKSLDSKPTFPKNGYIYVSENSARNYKLSLKDGKEWHIRICKYNGDGSCGSYSNELILKAPYGESSDTSSGSVDSIELSYSKKSDDSVNLKWSVKGTSSKGYKVVWGTSSKPTYPTRDGDNFHYLPDQDARTDVVKALKEGKTYYIRVCEYLGGKCGKYSNEVSVDL